MKIRQSFRFFILLLAGSVAFPLLAEDSVTTSEPAQEVIPVGSQAQALRNTMILPDQSTNMNEVLAMLGEPNQVYSIGEPKITRWSYDNLTVYFEQDKVLRTVLHESTLPMTMIATEQP